ncbi:hypothetical protein [Hornefia butyriciproducens]|uniref:hypothetical protein n=1 Tax=Hornefia butyriciproducens TaxID=2652293 RepID=UPI002A9162C4|nr:hypothetical protein [Hornefia butyriciproducens]MDY5424100.1 hypothetical protein [Hornefia butyriciproducens]
MLLILLGVVILVILVIAFMFNMKKSEARNDQILGDLNDSISELQNRMNTVEGDRSAVIEVVSPRDTVEEASDTGDWVNYSRSSAEEPPKGRETQPEYAEQSRQLKPENRANRNTDMTGRPERSRREADTETDTDDFWSQFERSDSRSQSKNMERQTMEGYSPAAPAGRNPDVDFGMSAGRHGTEERSGSGQSPLDRQMESRRGAHAAQSGGLLNSFGFGNRKDDTIVIEHRPEEQWTEETEPRQSARQYEDSQRQSQAPQYGGQTIQQEQQYGQQQYGGSQRQSQPQAPQYGGQAMQQEQQYGQQYGDSQRQPQPQMPQYGGQTMQQGQLYGQQQYGDSQRQPQQAPQYGGQVAQTQDSQRSSSLAEQLQQATQRMQEMAQQARDAVPQMETARKDSMGQRPQSAVRTPSAERTPDMTHRTARDTANHYVDRESGTDRQGRVYSVEQLNEQIK